MEEGAELRVGGDPNLNIYYTGTVTYNGLIRKKDDSEYIPRRLTPTLYGDFDADLAEGDDDDVIRFNAAFPSVLGEDPEYDALVDWDCDGDVDCDDRAQYIANWPSGGIEDDDC